MLTNSTIVAQLATRDIPTARAFYVDKLGLTLFVDEDDVIACRTSVGSMMIIYERPEHRSPENTVATFVVADVGAEVAELRGRGVTFESYDLPGIKTLDGIATRADGRERAWFTDPDGNILALEVLPPD